MPPPPKPGGIAPWLYARAPIPGPMGACCGGGGAERSRRAASRRQRRRSSASVHSSAVQSAVAGSTLNLERARLHRLEKRLERALVDPARTLATGVPTGVTSSLVSKLLEH